MTKQLAGFVAISLLALPGGSVASEFRELVIRLDHTVEEAPVAISVDGESGLVAVGRRDELWHYSVISVAQGGVVATGEIPAEVFFYDTGDLMGRGTDTLYFLDQRGVAELDIMRGTSRNVAEIHSLYNGTTAQGPAVSDFVRDVDGDGVDDILLPQFGGWLLARKVDSGFERFRLDIPARVKVYEDRVSYQPRRPHSGDVDGDGLDDLVFLLDTEFLSFVQRPDRSFPDTGRRDNVGAPLASESQRAQWERDDGQVDQSDLEIEEVELVRDFNADQVPDLLTEKSISKGVFDRRSEYHLYLGQRAADSLIYPDTPDGSIASGGIQFDPLVVDVDGDGLMDIATPSTRLGLARIVSALFSGRIGVDLDVYRMRGDGVYAEDSDYRTRFKVEFDLETGLMRYPAVIIADMDGDGPAELLVQEDADELSIYPGVGVPELFGKREKTLSLPLPRNGQMVEARDVDDDGRIDLLVRYGPADGAERVGELRILISESAP